MPSDLVASLIYLGLLSVLLGGLFVLSRQKDGGLGLQNLVLMGLVFLSGIVAFSLWADLRQQTSARQSVMMNGARVEVPVAPDGHYYLTLIVNQTPVRFVVDTGASEIVLSDLDARRVGIDPSTLAYTGEALTANGRVPTARVSLDQVALGPTLERDVEAVVNGGGLADSLLGMSYLRRFARLVIEDGRLLLER